MRLRIASTVICTPVDLALCEDEVRKEADRSTGPTEEVSSGCTPYIDTHVLRFGRCKFLILQS